MVTFVKLMVAIIKIEIFFAKIIIHNDVLAEKLEEKLASYGE